jgi:ADP-heptose:LPS heptosyltransferase
MHKSLLTKGWRGIQPYLWRMVRKYRSLPEGFAPRKVLAVRIQGAGDVLLTTPALRSLRRRFPDAEIHYLAGERAAEILHRNPDIDQIIPVNESMLFSQSIWKLAPVIRKLRHHKYDLSIAFSRSAGLHAFLTACRIGFRIGINKLGSGATLHLPIDLHNGIRYEALDYLALIQAMDGNDLGAELTLTITPDDDQQAYHILRESGGNPEKPFAMLAVGGGRNPGWDVPQKRWSMESFSQLAQGLEYPVVIVGDMNDAQEVKSHFQCSDSVINLCGRLSLKHTAALLKRARVLVTNDTISMHFAVALRTPAVALFGPTHPKALLPDNATNVIPLQGKLPCVPCFWQGMPNHISNFGDANFPGCPKGNSGSPCLETITVSEVLKAIETFQGNQ